jgi:hypothetical protein
MDAKIDHSSDRSEHDPLMKNRLIILGKYQT